MSTPFAIVEAGTVETALALAAAATVMLAAKELYFRYRRPVSRLFGRRKMVVDDGHPFPR